MSPETYSSEGTRPRDAASTAQKAPRLSTVSLQWSLAGDSEMMSASSLAQSELPWSAAWSSGSS